MGGPKYHFPRGIWGGKAGVGIRSGLCSHASDPILEHAPHHPLLVAIYIYHNATYVHISRHMIRPGRLHIDQSLSVVIPLPTRFVNHRDFYGIIPGLRVVESSIVIGMAVKADAPEPTWTRLTLRWYLTYVTQISDIWRWYLRKTNQECIRAV